jgi:hypothetical protein
MLLFFVLDLVDFMREQNNPFCHVYLSSDTFWRKTLRHEICAQFVAREHRFPLTAAWGSTQLSGDKDASEFRVRRLACGRFLNFPFYH